MGFECVEWDLVAGVGKTFFSTWFCVRVIACEMMSLDWADYSQTQIYYDLSRFFRLYKLNLFAPHSGWRI
jgi:hypothetical protein